MQITRIDQTGYLIGDGLDPVKLDRLGRVVVLAGANGAGKTRLLRRVEALNECASDTRGSFNFSEPVGSATSPVPLSTIRILAGRDSGPLKSTAVGVFISPETEGSLVKVRVAMFKSGSTNLSDPDGQSPKSLRALADKAGDLGGSELPSVCLCHIQVTQDRWREATHPERMVPDADLRKAIDDYDRLQLLVTSLIGVELKRDREGRATLFDQPIAKANLSEGQKVLLMWCVMLHAQCINLKSVIVTVDEPENHLHPEDQIEILDRIIRATSDGQVWIATHSLPLIAALYHRFRDDLSLYFIDSGRVSFAGKNPEKVLGSLMGGDDNVVALREFIDFPDVLATSRFAAECLAPSNTIADAKSDYPQNALIASEIMDRSRAQAKRKVLDFGAGHARLLNGIAGLIGDTAAQDFDYVAWERPGSIQSSECRAALERCYHDSANRWFNDRDQLFANFNPEGFDYVVMCNVLHEIDPKDWLSLFEPNGIIFRALSPQGQLLIVEDYLMPKGEYAHPYGFIVLGTDSLKSLFQIDGLKTGIEIREANGKYTGRIRAHLVSRALLPNVTSESRKQALQLAARNAEDQIARLRQSSNHDFRSGQAHAFWVQQFANATLACKSL